MEKRILIIGIIFLLLFTSVAPISICYNIKKSNIKEQSSYLGNTLYVGGSGPNNYTRIQDAIANASDGDTIFVFNGVYIVNEFTISKSISLIGEDKYSTIIDGNGSNFILKFEADFITINGFTLQNVEYEGFTCLIEIRSKSHNNIIVNNIFNDSSWYAIRMLFTSYNTFIDNIIVNCGWYASCGYGIDCGLVTGSIISNNTIIGSSIILQAASDTLVTNNHITNNQIYLTHGYNVTFEKNIIENGTNIEIKGSTDCIIEDNLFINSGSIILRESKNIRVNNNTFDNSYGVLISGDSIDFWKNLTISNNKINGKPIYYYKDKQHITISKDAAQVILVSCNNCIIENINIIKSCGIQLALSSNNIISNNNILESFDSGIKLIDSSKNNISYNTINYNKNCGVESIGLSGENIFYKNTIMNNYDDGITISDGSPNNYIYNNFIQYNQGDGIELHSDLNIVLNNLITDHAHYGYYGIYCSGSNNNISRNHIESNDEGLRIYKGKTNIISQNNFINNDRSVSFYIDYKNITSNNWIKNYYDDFFLFVKLIWGTVQSRFGYRVYIPDVGYEWVWICRKGINIDYHPAKEPYDI